MKLFILIFLLSVSALVNAGDYMIYIADSKAVGEKCSSNKRWQIESSAKIVMGLKEYFNGQRPSVMNLKAAFSNGHFHFCGASEVDTVLKGLYAIKRTGPQTHKAHLQDFIDKIESVK